MKTYRSLMVEGSKEEYQKFFDKKLAKWKVKSPAELSDEDKKKFFNEIEKEWTGDKDEELVKEYIKKDGARRRCAGGDGRKTKKVKTEEEDCEDDEEMEEGAFIISKDTKFTAQQISDVGNKIGIPRPQLKKLVTQLNKFHG
tara:strand:+ start:35 stop:460 length:426 start_codon:yes stop_codon:yes gene_type:complete